MASMLARLGIGGKPRLSRRERARYKVLLSLVNEQSQPNLNALMVMARDIRPLSLSLKQSGYELARSLAAALPPPGETSARPVGLASKPSVQIDLETDWAAHWARSLRIPIIYHRKVWEFVYVLQALYDHGCLEAGKRGLGFGCGEEPLISYFASLGIEVLATDLDGEDPRSQAWAATSQHVRDAHSAFRPDIVDRSAFDQLVRHRAVDMNDIPADLDGYDFCWSICAMEHLGSIRQGLDFVLKALATLKPGGIAVHTTEHNIDDIGRTIDNWPCVLFQRHHFETLAQELARDGHEVAPFDFSLGSGPMDRFIDLPPWGHEIPETMRTWLGDPAHMKLSIDGFVSTCFGLTVRKKG